jgi:hypothetical protein
LFALGIKVGFAQKVGFVPQKLHKVAHSTNAHSLVNVELSILISINYLGLITPPTKTEKCLFV